MFQEEMAFRDLIIMELRYKIGSTKHLTLVNFVLRDWMSITNYGHFKFQTKWWL